MRGIRNQVANFCVFISVVAFIGGFIYGEPLTGIIAAGIYFLVFMVVRPR